MTAQWVQLRDGETLVASRKGAWIQPAQAAALALWGSMPHSQRGTLATTRHLLEGAMSAGERDAAAAGAWPPSARRWALDLIDQWYTAHHSVALLPVVIDRYDSMQRPELVRFACHKLEEEAGHDRLPLNDLRALGYDAEAAVKEVPPGPTARALVQYARDCVHGPEPVGFLGYIFALERRVIRITDDALRTLETALPTGVEATSGVRAHAVEFDHQHVAELVEFVSALASDDRTAVALACFDTAALLSHAAPADPSSSDLEREHRLARVRKPTSQATEPRSKS
ncbi:MAG: iron-containing redox enzyme family protein [Solirubrobacteraceae bacterium]